MPKITWNDDFMLGIEPFDAHHQHLISLINETTACLEKGAAQDEISIVLNSLIDYAWYHFNAEEKWMLEHSYPQKDEHEKLHKQFAATIIDLQNQLPANPREVAEQLSTYLNFWLIDHIVICDSHYATFVGTRQKPVLMT